MKTYKVFLVAFRDFDIVFIHAEDVQMGIDGSVRFLVSDKVVAQFFPQNIQGWKEMERLPENEEAA